MTTDITNVTTQNPQFWITAIPDPNDPPRDFVILRDDADWLADYANGEILTRELKAHLMPNGLPVAEVRALNLMQVNNSTVRDFADLPTETSAVYTDGIPLTVICRLARETGHIPYLCIPAQATDDCVRQIASLVATELPDILDQIKITLSNETWNSVFRQTDTFIYRGGALWGKGFAGGAMTVMATVTDVDPTVTVPDATGLVVGDTIGFYNSDIRSHNHARIDAINGNTLTMDRSIRLGTGQVSISASTSALNHDYHAKRSCEVMQLWEDETGAAPIRVMETHTVPSNTVSLARMQANAWRNSGDPAFVEPQSVHDALGITSYFYATPAPRDMTAIEAAFAVSFENGKQFLNNGFFNTADAGFDEMRQRFEAQRAVADQFGLDLVLYEGLSPHDVFNNTSDEFAATYASFVYSADFNPVWDAHFDLVRRFIDGPTMQYSDIFKASRFGIWGLYQQMGVANARSNYILAKAASLTRWWGADVAPQLVGPAVLAVTTNDTLDVDLGARFTNNAVTFSATGLPADFLLSDLGVLDLDFATVTEDEVVQSTLFVQTKDGVEANVPFTFEIDFVDPIDVPVAAYTTEFDDATGVELNNGASVEGGNLVVDVNIVDPALRQFAEIDAIKNHFQANPSDEITISVEVTRPNGSAPGNGAPFMTSVIQVYETQVRVRPVSGSLETVATVSAGIIPADGQPHRLTITGNRTTGRFITYVDGQQVGDATMTNQARTFDNQDYRFGASFSASFPALFHKLSVWDQVLTAEEESAA